MNISFNSIDACLETLRLIVTELGKQHTLQASLRSILRTLNSRHSFLRSHLVIYDPETCTLRLCVAESAVLNRNVVYEPGMGITGQVFTRGKPVIVKRISESSSFQNLFFQRTAEEMEKLSFVSVPVFGPGENLVDGQEVLGVLSLDLPQSDEQTLQSVSHFMEVVAGIVGNQISCIRREMAHRKVSGQDTVETSSLQKGVVATSKIMRQIFAGIALYADSRSCVLLKGEAGCGKELLAGIIHASGMRSHMPFISFSCGTVESGSVEAEIFGVQKDALPHIAQTQKGVFERANSGTLFLHDIEKLPEAVQEKLLKALIEQEIFRIGSSSAVPVDVRVICSTCYGNPVEHGMIPELYQHLGVQTVSIPPLRERREDIVPLAEFFMENFAQAQNKSIERISHTAVQLLMHYAWPGNVRELRGCIEQAVAACREDTIRASHLPRFLQLKDKQTDVISFTDAVERYKQELLVDALQRARGNMLEASRLLNTSYRIINYNVKQLKIDPKLFTVH